MRQLRLGFWEGMEMEPPPPPPGLGWGVLEECLKVGRLLPGEGVFLILSEQTVFFPPHPPTPQPLRVGGTGGVCFLFSPVLRPSKESS